MKIGVPGKNGTPTTANYNDEPTRELGTASIPFYGIAVELRIPEREVQRWARARAKGKSFRSSPAYRRFALEVEKRYHLIDWVLWSTDKKYSDGIFENARRGAA